jgi:hypothetical protein
LIEWINKKVLTMTRRRFHAVELPFHDAGLDVLSRRCAAGRRALIGAAQRPDPLRLLSLTGLPCAPRNISASDSSHLGGAARAQFAFTLSFHFIFPAFSIGLASLVRR